MKIAHLTSVHPRYDTRIFLKQCRSLAAAGYDVTLVVADGKGNEVRDGVQIVDVGASQGRFGRVTGAARRVLRQAIDTDAELYHLHDPELLPAGLLLKRRDKRVIFDSHEDIPQDILTKPYIPKPLRHPASLATAAAQRMICRQLDGVVAATPFIRDNFRRMGVRCVDINNFPILGELENAADPHVKSHEICYVGSITLVRGLIELVQALAITKSGVRLNLVGRVSGTDVDGVLQKQAGWAHVNALGFLNRVDVRDVLSRSIAGVVTFKPGPNHLEAQPNKMFEYMAAGLPIIASDFPLWREIVEGNECGILADPLNPAAIAAAIDQLLENLDRAHRMGENGRRAVTEYYNWGIEEEKLLALYAKIGA